jgi:hypothetical protein
LNAVSASFLSDANVSIGFSSAAAEREGETRTASTHTGWIRSRMMVLPMKSDNSPMKTQDNQVGWRYPEADDSRLYRAAV